MIRPLNVNDAHGELAKGLGKWLVYVGEAYYADETGTYKSGGDDGWELSEAAKCLGRFGRDPKYAYHQFTIDGGYIICDTEEECQDAYAEIVGDDGLTERNPYDGPYRMYACTYGPDGLPYTENT